MTKQELLELLKDAEHYRDLADDPAPYQDRIQWINRNLMILDSETPTPDDAPIPPCPGCK